LGRFDPAQESSSDMSTRLCLAQTCVHCGVNKGVFRGLLREGAEME